MTEDASLSDFLEDEDGDVPGGAADAGESDVDASGGDPDGACSGDRPDVDSSRADPEDAGGGEEDPDTVDSGLVGCDSADSETVDPVRPTYAWGDDLACAVCGDPIDRAWRNEDEYVCGSCKDW